MSERINDRLHLICCLRVFNAASLKQISDQVGISPKAVSKALNSEAGKGERRRLLHELDKAIMAMSLLRILDVVSEADARRKARESTRRQRSGRRRRY